MMGLIPSAAGSSVTSRALSFLYPKMPKAHSVVQVVIYILRARLGNLPCDLVSLSFWKTMERIPLLNSYLLAHYPFWEHPRSCIMGSVH
jgi:hypothetical protein